jgi:hypothetical protein
MKELLPLIVMVHVVWGITLLVTALRMKKYPWVTYGYWQYRWHTAYLSFFFDVGIVSCWLLVVVRGVWYLLFE